MCIRDSYRAVDFGIMGILNDSDKRYLAENFLAFFNRDYRAVAQAHIRARWVPPDTPTEAFESAVRTVCEPIFAKPISEISFGRLVIRLFQVARRFNMPIQPQLILLQKTLLNIEGLGRQLYPQLDLWETAKPFLERWMRDQIGPGALLRDFRQQWPQIAPLLPELPALIQGALRRQARLPCIKGFGPCCGHFGDLITGFFHVALFAVLFDGGEQRVHTLCAEHAAQPGKVVGLALQIVAVLGRG